MFSSLSRQPSASSFAQTSAARFGDDSSAGMTTSVRSWSGTRLISSFRSLHGRVQRGKNRPTSAVAVPHASGIPSGSSQILSTAFPNSARISPARIARPSTQRLPSASETIWGRRMPGAPMRRISAARPSSS